MPLSDAQYVKRSLLSVRTKESMVELENVLNVISPLGNVVAGKNQVEKPVLNGKNILSVGNPTEEKG
jgi:hypothetical protein